MCHYGYMSKWETREILDITLLIWITILFTHLIFYLKSKRNNIKGMNKEDIFEYFINDFDKNGSELGSAFSLLKTKTLIVKDLEGLLVVPPGLEPGTN